MMNECFWCKRLCLPLMLDEYLDIGILVGCLFFFIVFSWVYASIFAGRKCEMHILQI